MAKILTSEELQKLEAAKGKFVSTAGMCTAEGHEGIAHHTPFVSHEGTLVDYEVDENKQMLRSITLQSTDDGVHVVCLDVKNSDNVWNIHQMVFLGEDKREKLFDIVAD